MAITPHNVGNGRVLDLPRRLCVGMQNKAFIRFFYRRLLRVNSDDSFPQKQGLTSR